MAQPLARLPVPRDPREAALRAPPYNVEAEKALIGAIFVANRAYEAVSEFLRPEHFALVQNGRVFEACGTLIERGQIADPVTLRRFFERDDSFSGIGGTDYLAELAHSAVGIINAQEYGRLIFDLWRRRRLIELGTRLVDAAYDADLEVTPETLIADLEAELLDVGKETIDGPRPFAAFLAAGIAAVETAYREEAPAGVQTGLADLDARIGGLFDGDLTVLAGDTSMGKTALAFSVMVNAAGHGLPVLGFSLEMPGEHLGLREMSAASGLAVHRLRAGALDAADFARLVAEQQQLAKLPIWIDDRPGLTLAQIFAAARQAIRLHGIRLIVIDYLQLIQVTDRYRGNRVSEVGEITRGLKTLARRLGRPVLALCQLSREVARREDKRPRVSDLRESGSIEQDADNVWMVYRPEYYLERDVPEQRSGETDEGFARRMSDHDRRLEAARNIAFILIPKLRMGRTGEVTCRFDGPRMRFENFAGREVEPRRSQEDSGP